MKKATEKNEYGYNSTFPCKLRDLMEKNKTKQDVLAEKCNVKRQSIAQWKDGNTRPDILSLQKISEFYGVSTDYLLGLAPNPTTDEATKELCKTLNLSDASIEFLKNPENKEIVDTIDKLIEQHLIFERIGERIASVDEVYEIKTTFMSILRLIMICFELSRIDDVNVRIGRDGNVSISNKSVLGERTNFFMGDNNDFLQIVRLKRVAIDECFEKLKVAIRRTALDIDCLDNCYQKEIERIARVVKGVL